MAIGFTSAAVEDVTRLNKYKQDHLGVRPGSKAEAAETSKE